MPGVKLEIPFISDIDKEDITYACRHDGDFLALSFVSCREDVLQAKEILASEGREDLKIICKIESSVGVSNIDAILEEADGIMVARGDLGVEMPMEELPIIQKEIIKKCREQGKIAIVATEMLQSVSNTHLKLPTNSRV